MAKQVSLKASCRSGTGRQQAKKTRTAGLVPGVLYGAHIKPMSIQVEERELTRVFKHATSENMLVELSLDEGGKTSNRLAFIQEIQHHPIRDRVLHLDFHEVRADEKLRARVVVVAHGEPDGVRTGGGILEQVLHELEVECLPRDLPDHIEVDVSALLIGGNIHVSQVKAPEKVMILSRGDGSVFTVLAPTKEEEVVASTEVVEPEVIKQKKVEEGEEPAEKGGKPEVKGGAKGEAKGAETKGGAKGETKGAESKGGKAEPKSDAKTPAKPAAKGEKK